MNRTNNLNQVLHLLKDDSTFREANQLWWNLCKVSTYSSSASSSSVISLLLSRVKGNYKSIEKYNKLLDVVTALVLVINTHYFYTSIFLWSWTNVTIHCNSNLFIGLLSHCDYQMVRAPDSQPQDRGFKSRQNQLTHQKPSRVVYGWWQWCLSSLNHKWVYGYRQRWQLYLDYL